MFTDKKREGMNRFVCDVSLCVAETPKVSIKDHEPLLPIIPFGIVAYGFVGQPFSKQLYTSFFSPSRRSPSTHLIAKFCLVTAGPWEQEICAAQSGPGILQSLPLICDPICDQSQKIYYTSHK